MKGTVRKSAMGEFQVTPKVFIIRQAGYSPKQNINRLSQRTN